MNHVPANPPNANSEATLYCPNCKGENPQIARLCMWCGQPLSQPSQPQSSAPGDTPTITMPYPSVPVPIVQRTRSRWLVPVVVGVLLAAIGVGLTGWLIGRQLGTNTMQSRSDVPVEGLSNPTPIASGETVAYNSKPHGISAKLPAGEWERTSSGGGYGTTMNEMRLMKGNLYSFGYIIVQHPNYKPSDSSPIIGQLQELAKSITEATEPDSGLPRYKNTKMFETTYKGHQALRVETTWIRVGPDIYTVFYFFMARMGTKYWLYEIEAGANDLRLMSSGEEDVEAMLDSIQLSEPTEGGFTGPGDYITP